MERATRLSRMVRESEKSGATRHFGSRHAVLLHAETGGEASQGEVSI